MSAIRGPPPLESWRRHLRLQSVGQERRQRVGVGGRASHKGPLCPDLRGTPVPPQRDGGTRMQRRNGRWRSCATTSGRREHHHVLQGMVLSRLRVARTRRSFKARARAADRLLRHAGSFSDRRQRPVQRLWPTRLFQRGRRPPPRRPPCPALCLRGAARRGQFECDAQARRIWYRAGRLALGETTVAPASGIALQMPRDVLQLTSRSVIRRSEQPVSTACAASIVSNPRH